MKKEIPDKRRDPRIYNRAYIAFLQNIKRSSSKFSIPFFSFFFTNLVVQLKRVIEEILLRKQAQDIDRYFLSWLMVNHL